MLSPGRCTHGIIPIPPINIHLQSKSIHFVVLLSLMQGNGPPAKLTNIRAV